MKIHFALLDISLVKTATEKSYVLEHLTSLPSAGRVDDTTSFKLSFVELEI